QGGKSCAKQIRFKVTLEGFSQGGDARGEGLASGAVFLWLGFRTRGIGVIEHHVGAAREASDEAKGRKDGLLRELRHHAQPREKSPLRWVEAGGCESVRQKLPLEIKRNEGELPGNRDRHLGEPLALPRLSGRMIDLEDAQGLRQGGPV